MKRLGTCVAMVMIVGTAMAGEITLTMRERAGHDRVDEPVRIGVPLPKGMANDVAGMALVDHAGKALPCQFTPVCRWIGDRSIKWVHLDFATSIDSGAARRLKLLTRSGKAPGPSNRLVVQQGDNAVTVTTGGLSVRLRGGRFNWFDSVTLDGKGLVRSTDAGIVLQTDAGAFSALNDPDGKVTVESQGPVRAVVKCEGTLRDRDGKKAFDYCVRFAFHAGLKRVNAAFTYINRVGQKPADRQEMRDLSIFIPTRAPAETAALVGTEKDPATTSLQPGEALSIFQTTPDAYTVFQGVDSSRAQLNRWASKVLARGKGKSTKPLTTGWGGYAWPGGGVAAGWRWFWQTFPSIIELRADGTMRLGLYPREGHVSLPVYMGQARTHYLTFVFGPEEPKRLNAAYAGVQRPLRAFPDAEYLCRGAAAFGPIGESDPKLYGEMWPRLENYDKVLREQLDNHRKRLEGVLYKDRFWIDGYGYRPWGDVVLWLYDNEPPWNVSWSGNYYDFSFACLLQFMRTGDVDFLDQVEPNTIHEADVFTVNYHPRPELVGACRYCPPRNHIGVDGQGGRPYVSVEFNHHKAQSTFAMWYLFGDERMRDVALLKLNNAYANREADNGWKQIRGPGAQLATLSMGYEYSHNTKYLDRMKGMVARARRRLEKNGADSFAHSRGYFMYGIGLEGIIYEYLLTGDKASLDLVKALTDYLIESKRVLGVTCNISFALAFLYHETGDPTYREWCLEVLERQKPRTSGELKAFGQSYRNAPRAFYYLMAPPRAAGRG